MKITKKLIKTNFQRRNEPIKNIVIHDTGNTGKGANAIAHYNFFNKATSQCSADFVVDDLMVIQLIEPNNFGWHCGDGYGRYGIKNSNSIGIEMCINSDSNRVKTKNNLIELVKTLMKQHNIPIDRVVRHYDASRKCCPKTMSESNWKEWNEFKKQLVEDNKFYRVQVGAFKSKNNAIKLQNELKEKGFNAIIKHY